MSDITVRLADPQATLLEEIADPRVTVASVTATYAFALLDAGAVDWPVVNRAIIGRWSAPALDRVKRDAWRRVAQREAHGRPGDEP